MKLSFPGKFLNDEKNVKRVAMPYWIALLPFLLFGCASKPVVEPFYTRLYSGSYEEVWDATLRAIRDYPLKFTNKDGGKIQTEVINGPYNDLLFTHPEPVELPERFRFAMKLQLANVGESRTAIRIRITKELEKFSDFYTGWIAFPPDGLEERILLYRISQIFEMQQTLKKKE